MVYNILYLRLNLMKFKPENKTVLFFELKKSFRENVKNSFVLLGLSMCFVYT